MQLSMWENASFNATFYVRKLKLKRKFQCEKTQPLMQLSVWENESLNATFYVRKRKLKSNFPCEKTQAWMHLSMQENFGKDSNLICRSVLLFSAYTLLNNYPPSVNRCGKILPLGTKI